MVSKFQTSFNAGPVESEVIIIDDSQESTSSGEAESSSTRAQTRTKTKTRTKTEASFETYHHLLPNQQHPQNNTKQSNQMFKREILRQREQLFQLTRLKISNQFSFKPSHQSNLTKQNINHIYYQY